MRLFTGYHDTSGPIIQKLDENLDEDVEVRDLTMYDSSGYCNMVSLSSADVLVPPRITPSVKWEKCRCRGGKRAAYISCFDYTCLL